MSGDELPQGEDAAAEAEALRRRRQAHRNRKRCSEPGLAHAAKRSRLDPGRSRAVSLEEETRSRRSPAPAPPGGEENINLSDSLSAESSLLDALPDINSVCLDAVDVLPPEETFAPTFVAYWISKELESVPDCDLHSGAAVHLRETLAYFEEKVKDELRGFSMAELQNCLDLRFKVEDNDSSYMKTSSSGDDADRAPSQFSVVSPAPLPAHQNSSGADMKLLLPPGDGVDPAPAHQNAVDSALSGVGPLAFLPPGTPPLLPGGDALFTTLLPEPDSSPLDFSTG